MPRQLPSSRLKSVFERYPQGVQSGRECVNAKQPKVCAPGTAVLPRWVDSSLGATLGFLVAVIAVFERSALDLVVQDRLFDFENQQWLVSTDWRFGWLLFHEAPTWWAAAVGVSLLLLLLGPADWRRRWSRVACLDRRVILVGVLTLITVPAFIALGKKATNMYCPAEVTRYGGDVCYVKLFERHPEESMVDRRGRCFPAAHASGGFALVGLVGLMRTRRAQQMALTFALTLGWVAGGYQMVTGSHYLSHTLVSMAFTWIVFLLWRRVLGVHDPALMRSAVS